MGDVSDEISLHDAWRFATGGFCNGLSAILIIDQFWKAILVRLFSSISSFVLLLTFFACFCRRLLSFGICLRWKECWSSSFLLLMKLFGTIGSFCVCFAKVKVVLTLLLNFELFGAELVGFGDIIGWWASLSNIPLGQGSSLSFSWVYPGSLYLENLVFPTLPIGQRIASNTGSTSRYILFLPLFKKADIFMDWLLFEPCSVGLFHLATRLFIHRGFHFQALSRQFILAIGGYYRSKWCH